MKRNFQEVNNAEQSPAKKSHERELIPFVHFLKRGKPQRYEVRVKCHAITGTVSKAHLTQDGIYGYYTVTLNTGTNKIERACDSAMHLGFEDNRVFKKIPRTTKEKFVAGATHSVLKGGIFLKRKLYSKHGKNSEPSFFDSQGKRIYPKSIGVGSIVQVECKLESYCVQGGYGLRGVFEKNIVVHELVSNPLDDVPYIED